MINLAVSGAQGRMGQTIAGLAFSDPEFNVTTLLEHKDHPKADDTLLEIKVATDTAQLKGSQALIEFTLPEGTMENLKAAVAYAVPMVIGTTGFSDNQLKEIEEAAKSIPIVLASNMSIGVNILFKLIEITSSTISPIEMRISETHHVHKKDAPSGTAKTMQQIAEKSSGQKVKDVDSIRKGEVIGDHQIEFETNDDLLTISHHAKDRRMFAQGALTAAKFLQDKKPGLYSMQDVLGLNTIK